MFKYSQIVFFSLLSLVMVTSVARADDQSGIYVELNPGYSTSFASGEAKKLNDAASAAGALTERKSGFGANINLGYQFNQYLATELEGTWFNMNRLTFNDDGDIDRVESTTLGFSLAGRATLPIRLFNHNASSRAGLFGIFVKAGPGFMVEFQDYDDGTGHYSVGHKNANAFAAAYGGGVEYNLTNSIAINTQVNAMSALSNRDKFVYTTRMLVSGGIKFTF